MNRRKKFKDVDLVILHSLSLLTLSQYRVAVEVEDPELLQKVIHGQLYQMITNNAQCIVKVNIYTVEDIQVEAWEQV